jgi:hypothetical protein
MASFNIPFLSDIFGKPKVKAQAQNGTIVQDPVDLDGFYSLKPENWFTSKPYGFRFYPRNGNTTGLTMYLPINPSNIQISTNFATNMITTLYGTVEEHSPVRYYDIVIEGTTGMSPKYVEVGQNVPYKGRASAEVVQSLSGAAGGFFSKTLGILDTIRNAASSLSDGTPQTTSGVDMLNSGYAAFHNLYRLLLKYKQDVSGDLNAQERKRHPLTFFNYKDNNEYDVVVRNFTLRRSAENPQLYYYSITLRGYNLRTANGNITTDSTADQLKALGLDGVDSSSFLATIKGTANKVKSVLGPLGAGINILGR